MWLVGSPISLARLGGRFPLTRTSRGDTRIVPTSVTRRGVDIISRAHAARGILAIRGPAGIGKTTAIQEAKAKYGDGVIVVTPRQVNTPIGYALRLTLDVLRVHIGASPIEGQATSELLQHKIALDLRTWFSSRFAMKLFKGTPPYCTIIFDESQNLSARALDALRRWNDRTVSLPRPPIGLVFVGETGPASREDPDWTGVVAGVGDHLSGAVESFGYHDLSDEDIQRVVQANGLKSPEAVSALLDYCRQQPPNRDLRTVLRIVRDAKNEARSGIASAANIVVAIRSGMRRA